MKYFILWLSFSFCMAKLWLAACFKCNFYYDDPYYACKIKPEVAEIHRNGGTDENVELLEFKGNLSTHLSQSEFSAICERFKHLKEVRISFVKSLDENLLQPCQNLNKIWITNSEMKQILELFFSSQLNLTEIELSNSKLMTLPENIFINQKKLKILYLFENQIINLPPNIFKSLGKLTKLSLSENKIQKLIPKWFENLQSLAELYLSDNKIQDLPKNVFTPLENLKVLVLSNNQLTTIHSDSFGIHRKLKKIFFVNNTINAFNKTIIDNTAVEWLHLRGNNCSSEELKGDKNEMKANLSDCFKNYHPRVELAAHCMNEKQNLHNFTINDFSVLLGVHNLSNVKEEGRIEAGVSAIRIHPNWDVNGDSYDADVAVLELQSEIEFSKYVRPICVPDIKSGVASSTLGTVVGLGMTETGQLSDILKNLEIPIYDYKNCTKHSSDYSALVSSRSFCGGPADRRGVCSGDSGGGVFVKHNNVYYLRGLVSSSLVNIYAECDVHRVAVFTDVPKFYGWIKSGGMDDHAENRETSIIESTTKMTIWGRLFG